MGLTAIKNISLLGCGWLGTDLAAKLSELGYDVLGSTTTNSKFKELKNKGIIPSYLEVTENEIEGDTCYFFETDLLILNLPVGRNDSLKKNYLHLIEKCVEVILENKIPRILYISSTSVYGQSSGQVNEDSRYNPETDSGKLLVEAETLMKSMLGNKLIITRLGGLIGTDRQPGDMFINTKKTLNYANAPVNLIHKEDAIGAVVYVIEKGTWGQSYNLVCDEHPTKKELYGKVLAEKENTGITFQTGDNVINFKVVSNDKIKTLGYNFRYKSPFDMLLS